MPCYSMFFISVHCFRFAQICSEPFNKSFLNIYIEEVRWYVNMNSSPSFNQYSLAQSYFRESVGFDFFAVFVFYCLFNSV